jgi:subtilisin family serine protease
MNGLDRLAQPWGRAGDAYSTPGTLILKLELGEAPPGIPHWRDVRDGMHGAAESFGIAAVDRTLRHFSDRVQITRLHASAANYGRPGKGHLAFDGLEHAVGLSRTFRVDLDEECSIAHTVQALRQYSRVEEAAPRYLCVTPFAEDSAAAHAAAWQAREQIGAPRAMAYEPGDAAVIVAIMDTGVQQAHPELRRRLRRGDDTVQLDANDVPTGLRLLSTPELDNDVTEDVVGHGTSCAGIIGARGEQMPPGLAGLCSLLPIRVLGAALFPGKTAPVGIGAIADIDCGLKLAIDLGAKVLNLSFGTPFSALDAGAPAPHADVVKYGLARGCILVAASGNSGLEERFSPAALDGVIAVGAVGQNDQPTAFTTRGEHVALCAPGEKIVSSGLGGYAAVTGTSFAAPFVTAAAALLVSRAESKGMPLDGMTARRLLTESARPWQGRATQPGCGTGILDVYAALQALDSEIASTVRRQRDDRHSYALA